MEFRFSTQPPKTLLELHERIRELLPQLAPLILRNYEVGVTETAIAHGLKQTPQMAIPFTHNLSPACECRFPDERNVYVRAAVPCVCNILVIR